MLGFYNYTVILTYLGMLFGFSGITCILSENRKGALLCLMIAGICDMFDGKIASTMQRTRKEKRFGVQIDSLSDLICFGVLPALIVYTADDGPFRFVSPAAYLLCALIRLAWFNVDEEERQEFETGRRRVYYGLPVTTAALILPVTMNLCAKWNGNTGRAGTVVLAIMAIVFLTPFKLKKPSVIGRIGMLVLGVFGFLAFAAAGTDV